MKKILVVMLTLMMALSLVACGGSGNENNNGAEGKAAEFVSMTFGDITMSVPNVFSEVSEKEGVYLSAGPNASISATPAMEIDLLPSEWDESLAAELTNALYGSTYNDIEMSSFDANVNMNGNTAVYMAFYGKNSSGIDRLVQVVRLYNTELTEQYVITLVHTAEDTFFTAEVGGKIINSITLGS